jgi:hypothetical protein
MKLGPLGYCSDMVLAGKVARRILGNCRGRSLSALLHHFHFDKAGGRGAEKCSVICYLYIRFHGLFRS